MKKLAALIVVSFTLFTSCEKSSQSTSSASKPDAFGEVGKVVILINDDTYAFCKSAIKQAYSKPLEGIASNEPYFKVNQCNEASFSNYFKHNFNLCIAYQQEKRAALINLVGVDFLDLLDKKIANGESFFIVKDLFAQPQEVCVVLGKNDEDLERKFIENKDKLLSLALATERKTTSTIVFRDPVDEDQFYKSMMNKYGYSFRTPSNFKRSVRSDEFNGVNRIIGEKRTGIYVYEEPYTGDEQFSRDYIIKRRNEILKRHLHGPDRKDSIPTYVTTDSVNVKLFSKEIDLNGFRAIETRGWWEMENEFFGGPFLSYTIHCPSLNKVVTIEGNIFAPSKDKQQLIRTIALTASTFEVKK